MRNQLSAEALELLSALPVIRRARGRRLYAEDGTRLLDLFADAGRSIAGRREGDSGRTAKDSLDRGLVSAFPSFWEKRLEKSILAWLPGYAGVRVFPSEVEALTAIASLDEDFSRSLRAGASLGDALDALSDRLVVEVPFGEYRTDLAKSTKSAESRAPSDKFSLALLPVAPAWSVGAALARDPDDLKSLPAAQIPALRLAAAARCVSDFLAFAPGYDEARWAATDPYAGGLFSRSGPWLYPRYPRDAHARIFKACLEKGILISPEYDIPSSAPAEFDSGELSPLKSIGV